MTATEAFSDNAYLPGTRRWRAADLSVLVLVIVALVCAVVLRQLNVNATQTASFEGVVFRDSEAGDRRIGDRYLCGDGSRNDRARREAAGAG